MSGPTSLPMQGFTSYLGSAATLTAAPSLDLAAAKMIQQYPACVAVGGYGKEVLETRSGIHRFDFSCRPSPTMCQGTHTCTHKVETPCLPAREKAPGERVEACTGESEKSRLSRGAEMLL